MREKPLKFKLDENIPVSLKRLLYSVDNTFDVQSIFDENIQGIKDAELVDICLKERRLLITLDTDFLDSFIYSDKDIYGIILLRSKTQGKYAINQLFQNFLKSFDILGTVGKVVIVDHEYIRIREQEQ